MNNPLVSILPQYERKNELAVAILETTEKRLNQTEAKVIQTENELFLDKMIEAVPIHERDLGVIRDPSMTLQERREVITARYRAVLEQTTDDAVKSVAESFGSGEGSVKITETEVDGIFEIAYDASVGLPSNIYNSRETLNMILPAHLGYRFAFQSSAVQAVASFVQVGQNVTIYPKSRSDEFE